MSDISPGEARELFPPLAAAQRALYYRKAARVDGRRFTSALLRAAPKGLVIRQGAVERLEFTQDAITIIIAGGKRYTGRKAIIAGGAWSAALGDQLGVEIPVQPQRGQIIHLKLADTDTSAWPIVEPFRGHYLVCWPDSRVVAGATRELVGFNTNKTAAGVHEVLSEALRVAPGLAGADIGEIRVGLRPYTADHLPVLGAVPGVEGVYLATGMGATGLHLGPFRGKLAADWALGQASAVDISAFGVGRFGR